MTTRRTTALGMLALSATAALLTACSAGTPAAQAAAPAKAAPTKDVAAACAAQVSLDSTIPPGIDPGSPAPSAQEMQAWAASVEPYLNTVRQNVPDELAGAVSAYTAQLATAKQGQRIDVTSPENAAATNTLDGWVHDSCGFQTLDVTNDGGALAPVSTAFKPGPVAVRFANVGDPAKAGFVMLLARVKDGQQVTPADLDTGGAEIAQVADVAAGAVPTGPSPAYTVAVLKPGSYVVSAILGAGPQQVSGSTSVGFTVSP